MDPEKVLARAKARGLDAIAITDHDTIDGAREALEIAQRRGDIQVIIGEEIDTRAGDILGVFIHEVILEEDPLEVISAIHEQGGIAILPHPFSKTLSIEQRVADALDACEGFNARHSSVPRAEGKEGDPRAVALAKQHGLTLTASSDAHFYREVARARTIVPASNLEDAKKAILAGNTAMSGRRSHPFNRLQSVALHTLRRLLHPEPED